MTPASSPDYFANILMMDLRKKYDDAFRAKLCECLAVVLPGFEAARVIEYAPRVTIKTFEGQKLKEVYLDVEIDEPESGTYLFCFSDDVELSFSDNRLTATIG